jgi:tetratricopeptide (TPR) repeat protein
LESKNAEWVAKHLVMAGRLLDEDPELAFQHALAASRRGGRMAPVREAVGLTAYAAGHYGEALREFRTFRRISGSNEHLPIMADCERGLGRPDRALELTRSEDAESLDTAGKVELAIVASGARTDLQQFDAAVAALEIPQLDRNRAFSYSPRLFRAYADALEAASRADEAQQWRRQAAVAENALGVGDFAEPEIVDLVGEEPEPVGRPLEGSRTLQQDRADGGAVEAADTSEAAVREAEPIDASEAVPSEAVPADADEAVPSNGEAAPVVDSPAGEPTGEMDAPAPEAEDKNAPGTAPTPDSRDDDR